MKRRALWLTLTIFVALCAVCAFWVHQQEQQYARNRQLITALLREDTQTALALVNAGADPNTRQEPLPKPTFKSVLYQLLHQSLPPVNKSPTAFLIASGAPVISKAGKLWSVPENTSLLQAMLVRGADINAEDENKTTALCFAVWTNRLPAATLLVQKGADVNAKGIGGMTPLFWGAAFGKKDGSILRLLLEHGADPNVGNKDGKTALHMAMEHQIIELVSELLAHRANPNLADQQGMTPLRIAETHNLVSFVRLLKQHGAK